MSAALQHSFYLRLRDVQHAGALRGPAPYPNNTTEGLTEPFVSGLLPIAQPGAGDYRRRVHSARGVTCKGRLHSANGITGKWHHWLREAHHSSRQATGVSDRLCAKFSLR